MRVSTDRILTTHAGSLPRSDDLIAMHRARGADGPVDEAAYQRRLAEATGEVVERQRAIGIDVPSDGEYGKAMGHRVDYGAWWTYSFQRLSGLELTDANMYDMPVRESAPGRLLLNAFGGRRDRRAFAEAYEDPDSGITIGKLPRKQPVCRGPVTYKGHDAIRRDVANATAALSAAGAAEGFMTAIGPGSAARVGNEYYATDEELVYACADALREEYQAIIDAGLILQIDDPGIAESWDQITPEPSVRDYRQFVMTRVEALNHALRGLPRDRVRFHLCWGSWHGPHVTDLPMADIVDVMLAVDAGAYVFEAGNVRHEHEWRVWRTTALPEGRLLIPGVVSHATNVVEHPRVVADRILRFADAVGRENVIAATDCGLGGRVHPQIAWAKLDALVAGADLASRELWGRA